MRKAKILSFVSFTAAFFLHIGLTNGIEAYEPYQRIGSAMITLTFAAVLFYFGLCHSKGWHGAEIKKIYNEWYVIAAFVLISGLVMAFDFIVLEYIKRCFFEASMIVLGIEGYRKTKGKVYLLYILIALAFVLWDFWPQIIKLF